MRVLLVDDEAAFVRPLAERLSARHRGRVALDAEAALVMVAEGEWDLVFLDVGLPGMDGVALLKLLRERHPDLDVVMLSARRIWQGRAGHAARRADWLSKPVSVDGILAEWRQGAGACHGPPSGGPPGRGGPPAQPRAGGRRRGPRG